jgi:death-on-curing protein
VLQTQYITLEQVLVIHEDQVEKYGGSQGVRSLALLESAVFRPQTSFGGRDLYETIFDKASSLVHSLILNHPFVDGNKRTAVVSTLTFLEFNGYLLEVSRPKLTNFALDIESKKLDIEKIAVWLQKFSKKIMNGRK